jgi:hypothetical protein
MPEATLDLTGTFGNTRYRDLKMSAQLIGVHAFWWRAAQGMGLTQPEAHTVTIVRKNSDKNLPKQVGIGT